MFAAARANDPPVKENRWEWCARTGSNRRPTGCKPIALPLSYSRKLLIMSWLRLCNSIQKTLFTLIFYTPAGDARSNGDKKGKFVRVGECLYRYRSNGVYYAFIRHQGKLHMRSLKTSQFRCLMGNTDSPSFSHALSGGPRSGATAGQPPPSNGASPLARLKALS